MAGIQGTNDTSAFVGSSCVVSVNCTVDSCSYLGGRGSLFLPAEGDKGVALASVVDISHSTILLKLALDVAG